jgi:hypothetical protein
VTANATLHEFGIGITAGRAVAVRVRRFHT